MEIHIKCHFELNIINSNSNVDNDRPTDKMSNSQDLTYHELNHILYILDELNFRPRQFYFWHFKFSRSQQNCKELVVYPLWTNNTVKISVWFSYNSHTFCCSLIMSHSCFLGKCLATRMCSTGMRKASAITCFRL